MIKYSKSHEWVKKEGEIGVIGITDYAQDQLGDIVYVELPEAGNEINKGEMLCTVESVKAASDIYSPVTCEITEVNEDLEDSPEIINEDAEGKGWICKVKLSDESELDKLMNKEEYDEFYEKEG
ncbi:MAG: glycine cleavage system protein GcvH [Thermotogota bacterium]|nr:glycine cleavage system protein GcvH [Thermotogota bacterium]